MLKILLLGKHGQLGQALQQTLAPLGQLIALDRTQLDISQAELLSSTIQAIKPDVIVNAIAYTDVEQAEQQSAPAYAINSIALQVLASQAQQIDAWLIHYSTDYVFDGNKSTSYNETDMVSPLSIYGKSKLAGEYAIQQAGCRYIIFRTGWLFSATGNNFALSVLKQAQQKSSLNVVADQYGAPTSAALVAQVTAKCIQKLGSQPLAISFAQQGIYHLVSKGETTWYGYAQYLITVAQQQGFAMHMNASAVQPISAKQYTYHAQRPTNSRLCVSKLETTFDIILPTWQQVVDQQIPLIVNRLSKGK